MYPYCHNSHIIWEQRVSQQTLTPQFCVIFSLSFVQLLLRKKAAEELKKEQERKAAERRRIIEERCGRPKDLDSASEGNVELSYAYFNKKIQMNITFGSPNNKNIFSHSSIFTR